MSESETLVFCLRVRKELGFTQQELATMLHRSSATVSRLERGKGSPHPSLVADLQLLARALDARIPVTEIRTALQRSIHDVGLLVLTHT